MTQDLAPPPLDGFDWSDDGCEASLAQVHARLVADAREAADWYAAGKRPKKRVGWLMRVGAIVLLALAGLYPVLTESVARLEEWSPLGASVAIGAAALLVALDRFMDLSSGWIRYITTETAIRGALRDFELDWQTRRAALRGRVPTVEQVAEILAAGREFAMRVQTLVAEETAAWATEFQANLKQLDEAVRAAEVEQRTAREEVRAAREAARPGALNLVVPNAAESAGGWYLSLNGGPEKVYMGPRASIAGLPPGHHHLRVRGTVGGVERASELTADVPSGTIATAEIVL